MLSNRQSDLPEVQERVDWAFINDTWVDKMPDMVTRHLPSLAFDHSMILIHQIQPGWETAWLSQSTPFEADQVAYQLKFLEIS